MAGWNLVLFNICRKIIYLAINQVGDDGCGSIAMANWTKLSVLDLCKTISYLDNNRIKEQGCFFLS